MMLQFLLQIDFYRVLVLIQYMLVWDSEFFFWFNQFVYLLG